MHIAHWSNVFDECIEMLAINHYDFVDISVVFLSLYFFSFLFWFIPSHERIISHITTYWIRMFEHHFYHSSIGLDARQNGNERKAEHECTTTTTTIPKKMKWRRIIDMTNGGHGNRSTDTLLSTWEENKTDRLNGKSDGFVHQSLSFRCTYIFGWSYFYKLAKWRPFVCVLVFGSSIEWRNFDTQNRMNCIRLIAIVIL